MKNKIYQDVEITGDVEIKGSAEITGEFGAVLENKIATVVRKNQFMRGDIFVTKNDIRPAERFGGYWEKIEERDDGTKVYENASTIDVLSWRDIALISESGYAQQYFNIGDEKTFVWGNRTYTARIIGFSVNPIHYYGGPFNGYAGITFEIAEIPFATTFGENATYTSSNLYNVLARDFEKLPPELKNVIKSVDNQNVNYSAGGVKLFIPTATQLGVFVGQEQTIFGDGVPYAYYADGDASKRATVQGTNPSGYYWTSTAINEKLIVINRLTGAAVSPDEEDPHLLTMSPGATAGVKILFCI